MDTAKDPCEEVKEEVSHLQYSQLDLLHTFFCSGISYHSIVTHKNNVTITENCHNTGAKRKAEKEREELRECTFQPAVRKRPASAHLLNELREPVVKRLYRPNRRRQELV